MNVAGQNQPDDVEMDRPRLPTAWAADSGSDGYYKLGVGMADLDAPRTAYDWIKCRAKRLYDRMVTQGFSPLFETGQDCLDAVCTSLAGLRVNGDNLMYYADAYTYPAVLTADPVVVVGVGRNAARGRQSRAFFRGAHKAGHPSPIALAVNLEWPNLDVSAVKMNGANAVVYRVCFNERALAVELIRALGVDAILPNPKTGGTAPATLKEKYLAVKAALGKPTMEAKAMESYYYQRAASVANKRTSSGVARALDQRGNKLSESSSGRYSIATSVLDALKTLTRASGQLSNAAANERESKLKYFRTCMTRAKGWLASENQRAILEAAFLNTGESHVNTKNFLLILTNSFTSVKPKVKNYFWQPICTYIHTRHGPGGALDSFIEMGQRSTCQPGWIPAFLCMGLGTESRAIVSAVFGINIPERGGETGWNPVKLGNAQKGQTVALHDIAVPVLVGHPMKGSPSWVEGGSDEIFIVPAMNIERVKTDTATGLRGVLTIEQAAEGLQREIVKNEGLTLEGHARGGWRRGTDGYDIINDVMPGLRSGHWTAPGTSAGHGLADLGGMQREKVNRR